MPEIMFYTTAGCHLCEQAGQMLEYLEQRAAVSWQTSDVADDPVLFERYGIRIPVLKRVDNDRELGWPFDLDELCRFVDLDPAGF